MLKNLSTKLHRSGLGTTCRHIGTPAHTLLEELESTLLGHVAHLLQLLDRLQTGRMLLTADDATSLGLHQVLLGEAAGRVMCGAVEHLGLGANGDLSATALAILTSVTVLTCVCHFGFYL